MNNILLVANWDSNVGYAWWLMENFWSVIAKEFASTGKKSILIYPSISKIPAKIKESPIKTLELDFEDRSFSGMYKLLKLIRSKRISYIYLSDKSETSLYYLLLRLAGIKKIFIHDHTPGERSQLHGIKKPIKKLYKTLPWINADIYIATSDYIRTRMIESSGLPSNKCYTATNGIEPIGRNPDYRYYAHEEFNLPHDAVLIITTGRASYYKRIDFLLKGFANLLLKKSLPNVYFIYCGDGPMLQDFKNLAKKFGREKQFIFAGNRKDVRMLLQSCDIGVQASKGEVGYSLSILEYMSAGLTTLVPDNPSVRQSVKDNEDGIIFSQHDINSFSDKLYYVITNPDLRNRLGQSAIDTIQNRYLLSTTNDELLQIFRNQIDLWHD